jgi:hypothetical protein
MNFIKALYEAPTIGIGIDSPRKGNPCLLATGDADASFA